MVKTPAALAGTSLKRSAKSAAPLRLNPAVTPAALKPGVLVVLPFSIKEKLLEKKAIIDQKSKGDKLAQERDTEKAKGNVR